MIAFDIDRIRRTSPGRTIPYHPGAIVRGAFPTRVIHCKDVAAGPHPGAVVRRVFPTRIIYCKDVAAGRQPSAGVLSREIA